MRKCLPRLITSQVTWWQYRWKDTDGLASLDHLCRSSSSWTMAGLVTSRASFRSTQSCKTTVTSFLQKDIRLERISSYLVRDGDDCLVLDLVLLPSPSAFIQGLQGGKANLLQMQVSRGSKGLKGKREQFVKIQF